MSEFHVPASHKYYSCNFYIDKYSLLNPNNISGPSFATSGSTSKPTPASSPPTSSKAPLSKSPSLPTGAKVGVGVGTGAALISIFFGLILLRRRKRRTNSGPSALVNQEGWSRNTSMDPAELSSNPRPSEMSSNALHELAQLETTERVVELPAKQEYPYGIGIAI
jgi:hypothetical protein